MERKQCPDLYFPPGFRFHPSDEELIVYYLRNRVASLPLPASIIADIELCKYNPWELPRKALFGEDEWYFFSPRDRKYPNGERPNRGAGSGYWKATGTDRPILTSSGSKSIGVKKALVFYSGRPPKGIKTDWIMNEYRLLDSTTKSSRINGSMRLDEWVLCRVRQKGRTSKNASSVQEDSHNTDMVWYIPEMEEACQMHTSYNTDMITDCLNKGCRLLASLLAGQAFPPIGTISCKDNTLTSDHQKDIPNKSNSVIPVLSFDSYSPLTRKPREDAMPDNLILSDKKLSSRCRNEDLLTREALPCIDVSYYSQNESQDNFYNPNTFDHISGFPELSELALTNSKYLP